MTLTPVHYEPHVYDSKQFCPVPQNRLLRAQEEIETLQKMIEKAEESDLTEEQRKNLEEAKELLQQAVNLIEEGAHFLESRNCIPANNRLLEAERLLTSCLEILQDLVS